MVFIFCLFVCLLDKGAELSQGLTMQPGCPKTCLVTQAALTLVGILLLPPPQVSEPQDAAADPVRPSLL